MKKALYVCLFIALVMVSVASAFHIIFEKMKIDELVLAKDNRSRLTAYFKKDLSEFYYRVHRVDWMFPGFSDDVRDELKHNHGDDEIYNVIFKSMQKSGYTYTEINKIDADANNWGNKKSLLEYYLAELKKADDVSDDRKEIIDRNISIIRSEIKLCEKNASKIWDEND